MKQTTDFMKMKQNNEKIVMLTAYDYPSAKLAEQAGVDVIFVGDSLGMVVLGYDSTIPVTLEDMIHHTKAVVIEHIGPFDPGDWYRCWGKCRCLKFSYIMIFWVMVLSELLSLSNNINR